MIDHKKRNQLLEATGKLAASPRKRRELVAAGLLSGGGRVSRDPVDDARPPRDRAAFVRALLGR